MSCRLGYRPESRGRRSGGPLRLTVGGGGAGESRQARWASLGGGSRGEPSGPTVGRCLQSRQPIGVLGIAAAKREHCVGQAGVPFACGTHTDDDGPVATLLDSHVALGDARRLQGGGHGTSSRSRRQVSETNGGNRRGCRLRSFLQHARWAKTPPEGGAGSERRCCRGPRSVWSWQGRL